MVGRISKVDADGWSDRILSLEIPLDRLSASKIITRVDTLSKARSRRGYFDIVRGIGRSEGDDIIIAYLTITILIVSLHGDC